MSREYSFPHVKEVMVGVAEEADAPIEPWDLVEETARKAGAPTVNVRRTLRELTHGKRDERELVHILDGRVRPQKN